MKFFCHYRFYGIVAVCAALLLYLAPVAQAQIPSSPLQEGVITDIFNFGRTAAGIGIGERALADLDIRVLAFRLVRGALLFVGLLFIALIVYGGFLYMTSGGNEDQTGKAKKVLARATIGVAIILSSYGITVFINRRVQRAIFENMRNQIQSCATGVGQASCCQEWNDFQSSLDIVGRNGDARRSEELYANWRQCYDRALESAGLPGRGAFRD